MTKQLRNKIPQIRFRGFDMEWEKKNLGELCEPLAYGLNAAATKYDGENKYLRITDIDDESRTFLKTGLTSPNVNLATSQSYLLQQRDIVFARTGASVGKSYLYKEADGRVFFAGFLIRARVKSDENPDFIFQNTLTEKYDAFVKLTSQRSGQPGINAKEYSSFSFLNPTEISEKNQIGTYFKELDRLIELHQHKHNKLVTLKQAMLQKMFPQEGANIPDVRFKDFHGEWEQKKVLEICDETFGGGTPRTSEEKFWTGNIPWIQSSDLIESRLYKLTPRKWINEWAIRKSATKLIPKDSIAIVTRVGVGKLALIEFDYATSQDFISLSKLTINQSFAVVALSILLQKKLHETQGTSIKGLTKDELLGYFLTVPASHTEQQKVGNYFRKLDELISQHSTQLDKLKQIKSACLEKMFV